MKKAFKGFPKIFAFTFEQQTQTKGYKAAVIIGVLLCLLLPALIMTAVEVFGNKTAANPDTVIDSSSMAQVDKVHVVDNSSTAQVDMNFLKTLSQENFKNIVYVSWGGNLDGALDAAQDTQKGLVLVIDQDEAGYTLDILLPENTALTQNDARSFQNFLRESFSYVLMEKSGLDYESLSPLLAPVEVETVSNDPADQLSPEEQAMEDMKSLLSLILPFILIMVIYFLVLLYGQGVATSIILEKNSKLMDTFLISVRSGAMVMGKTLAIALAGALQFMSWIAGAIGGFALGTWIVTTINPATNMALIQIFRNLGALSGLFSVMGILVGLMILLAGFLLYCSLAAIGGSLASKQEDLSSTNFLFIFIIVISFLACFYGGMTEPSAILNWIPFTAIFITPGQLMLGQLSIVSGLGILALVLMMSLLIMLFAGKLYTALALHKGTPPSLPKIVGLLKNK